MSTSRNNRKKKARPSSTTTTDTAIAATATSAVDIEEEDDEEEELFVVDDDVDDDYYSETKLIASCQCTIVGIRYYSGTAHAGEYVTLVREPHNPYDGNAIRIDNMLGEKVGHIKKEQARILSPFMDSRESTGFSLEGTIPRPGNAYTMPCNVEFFVQVQIPSTTNAAAEQEENDDDDDVSEDRAMTLANQLERAFGRSYSFRNHLRTATSQAANASAPPPPKVESKRMDWTTQALELDKLFEQQSTKQLQNLPDIVLPDHLLKTKLLPYQLEGLKWMVYRETTGGQIPCFYEQRKEKGKQVWYCTITNSSQTIQPHTFQGGMLCDAMGLGKTLQTIALLLAAPPPPPPAPPAEPQPQCTLVVCPVSVMANWQQQIEQHVAGAADLNVGLYQGPNRSNLLPKIQSGNINLLLISYNTLSSEYNKIFGDDTEEDDDDTKMTKSKKKKKKRRRIESIFDYEFHRIILDEAHNIRNNRSRTFRAVNKIRSNRKWCLTGTPFVNRAEDVFALMNFLNFQPLNNKKIYQRAISVPMQQGNDDTGLACLRAAMAQVALRRSKASANIQLVDKTVLLTKVSFPDQSPHKKVYDALFGTVKTAFQAVWQDDTTTGGMDGRQQVLVTNYSNIFEKLLRLRQACCSARLVPNQRRERALEVWKELLQTKRNGDNDDTPKLTAKEGLELLEKLNAAFGAAGGDGDNDNDNNECSICLTEMFEQSCIILRNCRHIYCETCIGRVCATGKHNHHHPNCPLCRQPFTKKDMLKKSIATAAAAAATERDNKKDDKQEEDGAAMIDDNNWGMSPKIEALLETIKTTMKPDERGVVFSQFTSFLDLIQEAFETAGHSFTRLDGSMSTTKRIEAVRAFSSEEEEEDSPRFILCSLHAAGTGINLTRGSVCFMMDCWWNTAAENQAMDRIHRIGQTRPVTVHRFVMKDSIEERIVALQEVKSMQAKGAMQKLKPEEKKKARLGDLKGLLMIEDESD